MVRRKESVLDLLVEAPWWVSVVAAGAVFLGLRYILPGISGDNLFLKAFSRAAHTFAPLVALILLIPMPISLFNSWRKKKLLDSQNDLESIRSLGWKEFEELVGEA